MPKSKNKTPRRCCKEATVKKRIRLQAELRKRKRRRREASQKTRIEGNSLEQEQ